MNENDKTKNHIFSGIKDLYIRGPKSAFILPIILVFIIGIIAGFFIKGGGTETQVLSQKTAAESGKKILLWTCSMHPHIKQDSPGRCPICGMDLTPMKEDGGGSGKASLKLGDRARQLASVKTTPAVYRKLTKSIYTVGKINYDESKISHVTSWIDGRIDKLYVNFTGTIVQKDEHLVYIYSPELVSTQDEYLIAYRGLKSLQENVISETVDNSISLLENTRKRLLLLGITDKQIKELEQTQKAQTYLTIYAPGSGTVIQKNIFEGMYVKTGDRLFTIADLSHVWLYLDIYEYDIPWIRYGQDVEVTTEAFPGVTFHGRVVFIEPFLDEVTRTVRVRVNMENHEGKLKPGMYANAVIKAKFGANGVVLDSDIEGKYICPMHPDIISDAPDNCSECGMTLKLVGESAQAGFGMSFSGIKTPESLSINEQGVLAVPHSAVLYTGLRNIVYVESEDGSYASREINLGPKADGYYHIISGIEPGEQVVTSGNFLIDSQMQLLGKPSLMFPEGTEFEESIKRTEENPPEIAIAQTLDAPEFHDIMMEFMRGYFSIRATLANDSMEGIEGGILLMENNFKIIKETKLGLPENAHKKLTEIFNHTHHYIADLKEKSLDETRNAFKSLSKNLVEYIREFHGQIKDAEKVYIFFCPMVDAEWVQENNITGNPYYGTKMLNCGTLKQEIPFN